MKFFDPKEEVLDIQLTQYGKRLLAKGKLKPMYYAFFDDDILYESKAGGIIEDQNAAQKRIKEETPRIHTQHVYEGIRTNINQESSTIDATYQYQSLKESEKILGLPLGESALSGNMAPAWNVTLYHNEIRSSDSYITSSGGILRIPQLVTRIEPETFITYENIELEDKQLEYISDSYPNMQENMDQGAQFEVEGNILDNGNGMPDEASETYEIDKSFILIKKDGVFLDISEKNTEYLRQNFDIEVFISDVEGTEEKNTKKLYFTEDNMAPTQENVEYWLDINVDNEIPESAYCSMDISPTKKKVLTDTIQGCTTDNGRNIALRNFYNKDDNDGGDTC